MQCNETSIAFQEFFDFSGKRQAEIDRQTNLNEKSRVVSGIG